MDNYVDKILIMIIILVKAKSYKQYVYKVINSKIYNRKHFITKLLSIN